MPNLLDLLKIKKCVYFIQSMNGGNIKIGYSEDPEKRLSQLQTGSPSKLRILLTLKGNKEMEHHLQYKYKKYRIHGEWFRPSKEILQFIINKLMVKENG